MMMLCRSASRLSPACLAPCTSYAVSSSALRFQHTNPRGKIKKRKSKDNRMKRHRKGLYAGKMIQFGNKVSHSMRHTRRNWKPNVQRKRLWSEALEDWMQFKVTTHALKCIDKAG